MNLDRPTQRTLHLQVGLALRHAVRVVDLDGEDARVLGEHLGDVERAARRGRHDLEVARRLDLEAFAEPLDHRRRVARELH